MRAYKLVFACLIMLGLCGCGAKSAELPEPAALYEQIRLSADLPEMTDVAEYMLEANTGVSPDAYTAAVYYVPSEGMGPEEIIIIRAKDETEAARIEEKLQSWLTYREESARIYLTEYMPVIQAGVIRRDGLTVSLIVSSAADSIVQVYEGYK